MNPPLSGEFLTRFSRFGRVHLLDTVTSTNDYAFGLVASHEPAVVVARSQTRGRGRFRRTWYSDDDSLIATQLLFADAPDFPAPEYITPLAGLAAALALENITAIKTVIRWPNDILSREKKLAGLLCEQRRSAVAVGIGINVNQTTFPEDLPEAGSLRQATDRTWDKLAVLEEFLARLHAALEQAGKGETQALLASIKDRSAILHRRVEVQTLLRRHVGTVIDLDAEGRIVLRTDSGRLVVLGVGQVRKLT